MGKEITKYHRRIAIAGSLNKIWLSYSYPYSIMFVNSEGAILDIKNKIIRKEDDGYYLFFNSNENILNVELYILC